MIPDFVNSFISILLFFQLIWGDRKDESNFNLCQYCFKLCVCWTWWADLSHVDNGWSQQRGRFAININTVLLFSCPRMQLIFLSLVSLHAGIGHIPSTTVDSHRLSLFNLFCSANLIQQQSQPQP